MPMNSLRAQRGFGNAQFLVIIDLAIDDECCFFEILFSSSVMSWKLYLLLFQMPIYTGYRHLDICVCVCMYVYVYVCVHEYVCRCMHVCMYINFIIYTHFCCGN